MFRGRTDELKQLKDCVQSPHANLVVLKGRRRIGKSSLIEHFADQEKLRFIKIEGLAPAKGQTDLHQLDYFAKQLSRQTDWTYLKLSDWTDAFTALDSQISKNQKTLVLLDEISWLGKHNNNFSGYLKSAWDNLLKKNNGLTLVLCGSVSTWIEENIMSHTAFVGRIHLALHLKELPLKICSQFWRNSTISTFEKYKFLCLTGGIPRYLEELRPKETAEQNIHRLVFQKSGLLYHEFDDLFNESYNLDNKSYRSILLALLEGPKSFIQICKDLNVEKNGVISKYLENLSLAGFITRDYLIKSDGNPSKLSRYRLSDNYTRFYLKYILNQKNKIEKNLIHNINFESMPHWQTILGLQFQNLLNNNYDAILRELQIDPHIVTFIGPYFQNKTTKTKNGVEIDLLIQTKHHTHYICEFKFRKKIDPNVLKEIQDKVTFYARPKYISVRPVLIYEGELSEKLLELQDHLQIVSAAKFLD